jgi:hypothetical protein
MDVRKGYELRTPFLGRPVRPFHFAVFIATAALAATNIDGVGTILTGPASHIVGVVASLAAALLLVGWVTEADRPAEWGLLLAAGVWVSRATFATLVGAGWFAVALSSAWAVGAGGAYLLERADHRGVLGE